MWREADTQDKGSGKHRQARGRTFCLFWIVHRPEKPTEVKPRCHKRYGQHPDGENPYPYIQRPAAHRFTGNPQHQAGEDAQTPDGNRREGERNSGLTRVSVLPPSRAAQCSHPDDKRSNDQGLKRPQRSDRQQRETEKGGEKNWGDWATQKSDPNQRGAR